MGVYFPGVFWLCSFLFQYFQRWPGVLFGNSLFEVLSGKKLSKVCLLAFKPVSRQLFLPLLVFESTPLKFFFKPTTNLIDNPVRYIAILNNSFSIDVPYITWDQIRLCYIPKKFLSPAEEPQLTIQLCGTSSVLQLCLKQEHQAPCRSVFCGSSFSRDCQYYSLYSFQGIFCREWKFLFVLPRLALCWKCRWRAAGALGMELSWGCFPSLVFLRWDAWKMPSAGTTVTPATAAGSRGSTSVPRCLISSSRNPSQQWL